MKAIDLNKEQKDELLEMCAKLFPEYRFSFYHPMSKANMLVGFLLDNDSDVYDNCDIFIHWFEFCIKELTPELFPDEESCNCDNTYLEIALIHMISEHPVDYLYEEFKKL